MAKQIKLKSLLKEGYAWERKAGKPLPTIQEVMDEFQASQKPEIPPVPVKEADNMSSKFWVVAKDKRGELYVFNDGYYNTKEEAEKAMKTITVPKIVDANTIKVEAVPTSPNYTTLFDNLSESSLEEAMPDATSLDLSKIDNVEVDYDSSDYPDFADAYIINADYNGVPMTDEQLDVLNSGKYGDFIHDEVFNQLNESTKHFKNPVKVAKLSLKETLDLQKTAKIITESQYKKLLKENIEIPKELEKRVFDLVNTSKVNNAIQKTISKMSSKDKEKLQNVIDTVISENSENDFSSFKNVVNNVINAAMSESSIYEGRGVDKDSIDYKMGQIAENLGVAHLMSMGMLPAVTGMISDHLFNTTFVADFANRIGDGSVAAVASVVAGLILGACLWRLGKIMKGEEVTGDTPLFQ